jgi:hypothetical protein
VIVLALVPAMLLYWKAPASAAPTRGEGRPLVFVCPVGLCLLVYAAVRSDVAHIIPASFPALLVIAWLIHRFSTRGDLRAVGPAIAAWRLVFVWGTLAVRVDA